MAEKNPPKENNSVKQFDTAKYLLLETFRKNGNGVRTPVFFAEHNGLLYISTPGRTGKAKRLRVNDNVRVVPTDFRGKKVEGEWLNGKARIINDPSTTKLVNSLLYKQHPFLRRVRAFIDLFERPKRLFYSIEIMNNNSNTKSIS
jgi:PPOX class probable F420-dependent enzyme